MKNKDTPVERHAKTNCSCDKCWHPKADDERRAAEWWRAMYERHGWAADDLGYLR